MLSRDILASWWWITVHMTIHIFWFDLKRANKVKERLQSCEYERMMSSALLA